MKRRKNRIAKADGDKDKDKTFRLTDIDPEFVSLVRAGANRQRSFMVVKEDAESGGTNENHDTQPAVAPAAVEGLEAEGHTGSSKKSDGTETSPGGATDLASWLTEATGQLEELSLDIAIQRALDAQAVDNAAAGQASKQAHEIETTAAPAVKQEDEAESMEKAARLEAELAKTRRENLALKAKVARLSAATVGKSSVILTGEVTSKQNQADGKPQPSPSRGAFNRGGDMAAAVTQNQG